MAAHESCANLLLVFEVKVPCRAAIYNLVNEFQHDRVSVSDKFPEGPPTTPMATSKTLMLKARYLKRAVMWPIMRFVHSWTWHESNTMNPVQLLECKIVYLWWTPYRLIVSQKKARISWWKAKLRRFNTAVPNMLSNIVTDGEIWMYSYYQNQQTDRPFGWYKFGKTNNQIQKWLSLLFLKKMENMVTVALQNRRILNADWYTTICLPKNHLLLRQDNSSSRKFRQRIDILKRKTSNSYHPFVHPWLGILWLLLHENKEFFACSTISIARRSCRRTRKTRF